MYCENCGKSIDNDAIFCEHCGTKIKNKDSSKQEKKNIKIISKENKKLIIILIIIGFVYLFFLELKLFNSPNNALQNYLKNWKNENYESILENLNIENSKFTTKEIFSSVYPDLKEFHITKFNISECKEENKNKAKCHVSYQTDQSGLTYEKDYILEKEEKNRLFLFTSWNIVDSNIETLNDFLLYIPSGAYASLMNISLDEYRYKNEDKEGYDCYKIPSIFKGLYSLKVTLNNGIPLDKEISIKNQSYTYNFNIKDASKELISEIEKLGKEVVETFYQGIINKEEFENLKSNYDIQKTKDTYNELKKELEKTELTKFSINEVKLINIEMNVTGKVYLSLRINYDYDLKEGHHGKSSDSIYITLENINSKKIEKIESLVTYFSKKY